MWGILLICLGVTLGTWFFMYLDSRLFDKPKTKWTYIKTIMMTNVITLSAIYIITWLAPTKSVSEIIQSGGHVTPKISGQPTTFVEQLGEDMLSGEAPF